MTDISESRSLFKYNLELSMALHSMHSIALELKDTKPPTYNMRDAQREASESYEDFLNQIAELKGNAEFSKRKAAELEAMKP